MSHLLKKMYSYNPEEKTFNKLVNPGNKLISSSEINRAYWENNMGDYREVGASTHFVYEAGKYCEEQPECYSRLLNQLEEDKQNA